MQLILGQTTDGELRIENHSLLRDIQCGINQSLEIVPKLSSRRFTEWANL